MHEQCLSKEHVSTWLCSCDASLACCVSRVSGSWWYRDVDVCFLPASLYLAWKTQRVSPLPCSVASQSSLKIIAEICLVRPRKIAHWYSRKWLNQMKPAGKPVWVWITWTHLALHVRQLFSVLGVNGVGEQRVQVDAHLSLTIFFVLDLVMEKKIQPEGWEQVQQLENISTWPSYLTEHLRLLPDKLSVDGFRHQVVQTGGVVLWALLVLQLEQTWSKHIITIPLFGSVQSVKALNTFFFTAGWRKKKHNKTHWMLSKRCFFWCFFYYSVSCFYHEAQVWLWVFVQVHVGQFVYFYKLSEKLNLMKKSC